MAINYPLNFPSGLAPSSVRWYETNVVVTTASQFTLQRQTYEFDGSGWGLEITYDPLYRSEAQPLIAFLSSLRGTRGTFLFGDTLFSTPLGTGAGTPKVKGAGQTGFTLETDGWSNNQLVLKAGDLFQIDQRLYRNLTDATSDGSGNATLDIWPRLRGHGDNADIVVTSPKGLFRLSEPVVLTMDGTRNQLFPITFAAVEAL